MGDETDDETCAIEILPDEVLLKIFTYFSPVSLAQSVSRVCRRWRKICLDVSLWKYLHFRKMHLLCERKESLLNVIRNSKLLVSLQCPHIPYADEVLNVVARFCPFMKKLDMGFTSINSCVVLEKFLVNCSQVCHLNFEGVKLNCDCRGSAFKIGSLKSLSHLNLSHCMWVNDKFITLLANSDCKLTCLNIEGIPYVTNKSLRLLLNANSDSLESLLLDGEGLTDESLVLVRNCHNLVKFSLLFSENLSDSTFCDILSLKKLMHLKIRKGVGLSKSGITNAFLRNSFNNLVYLNLSECNNFNDDALSVIAQKCPMLESLSLNWCLDVSDKGLSFVVNSCPRIKKMSLIGLVAITGAEFCNISYFLPELRYLDLQQCSFVSDSFLERLVQSKPDLKVRNYWGEAIDISYYKNSKTDSNSIIG